MSQAYNPNGVFMQGFVAPAQRQQSVTPSDATTYNGVRALRIGTAGTVVVVDEAGTSVTYTCADKEVLQFGAVKVMAASTATDIVAWF